MLEKMSRYLLGYMTVDIRGTGRERFINLAVKAGVNFWDYKADPQGVEYSVKVNIFRRRKLEDLGKKAGAELVFRDVRGLPTKLVYIRRRPGLILGIIAAGILLASLSDNIWVLTTSGSEFYSDGEIFAAAEKLGVELGADYDDFDPVAAGRLMLLSLPELSWVSINNDGVVTDIAVKDRELPPKMEEKHRGVYNVVAGKTGVVRAIEAYEGVPVAKLDHVVKEGELCISGIWENKYGYTLTAPARGKVMAEVQQEFCLRVPKKQEVTWETDRVVKRELDIFSLRIPLSLAAVDFELCDTEKSEKQLTLLGMKLPVTYRETVYVELSENVRILGRHEMEEQAMEKLREYQTIYSAKGAKLLSEENEISFDDSGCNIVSKCLFLEDIAVSREVLLGDELLAD